MFEPTTRPEVTVSATALSGGLVSVFATDGLRECCVVVDAAGVELAERELRLRIAAYYERA